MIMAAHTVNQRRLLPERRDRSGNRIFWVTITAFEVLGWFLSHQA
jgi:hypothetical protein